MREEVALPWYLEKSEMGGITRVLMGIKTHVQKLPHKTVTLAVQLGTALGVGERHR